MGFLFLACAAFPFVELYLLVRIGRLIGALPTLAFVIVMGLLGAYLAREQGRRVLEDWQRALGQGRVPEEGVLGGALILLGGLLLILPGVISDVAGLLLLLPWTRRWLTPWLRGALERRVVAGDLRVQPFGFAPFGQQAERPVQRGHAAAPSRTGTRPGSSSRPGHPAPTEVGHGPLYGSEVIETYGEEVEAREPGRGSDSDSERIEGAGRAPDN